MMDEWTGQYVSSGAVAPGRREKLKKEGLAGGRRRPEVRLGVVDIEQEAALGQDLKVNGVPLVVLWAAGVPLGELVGRIGAREVADWAIGYLMDDQFSV
jgi:thioredoxin-like negative regulator of GroEL